METKTSPSKIKIETLHFLNDFTKPVPLKEVQNNILLKYPVSEKDCMLAIKNLIGDKFVTMSKDNNLKLTPLGKTFLNKTFESARKTRFEILHNIEDLPKLTTESFVGEVEEAFP